MNQPDKPEDFQSLFPDLEALALQLCHQIGKQQPPQWVINLIGVMTKLPGKQAYRTLYDTGVAAGRVHWLNLVYEELIRQLLESPTGQAQPEMIAARAWFKSNEQHLRAAKDQGLAETRHLLVKAAGLPGEEGIRFFNGFADGLAEGWWDEEGRVKLETPRFAVYLALLQHYQQVEQLPTYEAVEDFLKQEVGLALGGMPGTFLRLCTRIGLHKGKPGRPRKMRT